MAYEERAPDKMTKVTLVWVPSIGPSLSFPHLLILYSLHKEVKLRKLRPAFLADCRRRRLPRAVSSSFLQSCLHPRGRDLLCIRRLCYPLLLLGHAAPTTLHAASSADANRAISAVRLQREIRHRPSLVSSTPPPTLKIRRPPPPFAWKHPRPEHSVVSRHPLEQPSCLCA
jgi:hypothetical protein